MYKGYEELQALPAGAYLDWEKFNTAYDAYGGRDAADLRYLEGLTYANEYEEVGISASGTWYADTKFLADGKRLGSFVSTYDGVGYHANSAALLHGLLDGKARFCVYRYGAEKVTLKESTHEDAS